MHPSQLLYFVFDDRNWALKMIADSLAIEELNAQRLFESLFFTKLLVLAELYLLVLPIL